MVSGDVLNYPRTTLDARRRGSGDGVGSRHHLKSDTSAEAGRNPEGQHTFPSTRRCGAGDVVRGRGSIGLPRARAFRVGRGFRYPCVIRDAGALIRTR